MTARIKGTFMWESRWGEGRKERNSYGVEKEF